LRARSHGYSAGNWSTHNFYHADGNGNVTYLVNSSQGLAAKYRYDTYGNTLSSSGSYANINVYGFSSKEYHALSGLYYYYGFLWYSPRLQRWPNRDPLADIAFIRRLPEPAEALARSMLRTMLGAGTKLPDEANLYVVNENDTINATDALGLIGGLFVVKRPCNSPEFRACASGCGPGPISCTVFHFFLRGKSIGRIIVCICSQPPIPYAGCPGSAPGTPGTAVAAAFR